MTLDTPIEKIPRIGPVFQKKLRKMGIKTAEDLIFHFPHRYEDFSNIIPISKIKPNEQSCILGKVLEIKNIRTWKRKMFLTQAIIEDKSGPIKVIWFNQPYLTNIIKQGDIVCLAGKTILGKSGLYLSNPAFEKISNFNYQSSSSNLIHTGRIIPVYPETEGLSSRWLRNILRSLLFELKNEILEILPTEIMEKEQLLPIKKAIWQIHFPDSFKLAKEAKKRFSFEELFLIELFVLRERLRLNKEKAPTIPIKIELTKKFVKSLLFHLTDAQRKCTWQILKDLEKATPMSRLLQGDVGSGKTVIAVIAALNTVKAGFQTAFMAPTEILAKQHFQEVTKLLKPFKIRIAFLTGKEDKIVAQKLVRSTSSGLIPEILEISRRKLLEKVRGEIDPHTKKFGVGVDILIGTHSLIQDKVKFNKLGLCIVDEQHRFGVEQRARLVQTPKCLTSQVKQLIPHLLSMTATPIPRSLALTVYGDLDFSLVDEMPKGRKKIITEIIPPKERNKTYNFIKERVEKGEQAFVICPRIEPNEKEDSSWANVKAVKEEYRKLSKEIFPDLKVEILHGKMTPKEKEKIMKSFKNKKIDILVSTSVVEVGIDMPNATIMMIEGAERFGLAQLYQFRGRVGRSSLQSYCFLLTESSAKKTEQRLRALIKTENGLQLAQKDLEIRGPGSLTGAKQWGIPDLAMENLTNLDLVEKTREAAKKLLRRDPELKNHPSLKERLKKFKMKIHLE